MLRCQLLEANWNSTAVWSHSIDGLSKMAALSVLLGSRGIPEVWNSRLFGALVTLVKSGSRHILWLFGAHSATCTTSITPRGVLSGLISSQHLQLYFSNSHWRRKTIGTWCGSARPSNRGMTELAPVPGAIHARSKHPSSYVQLTEGLTLGLQAQDVASLEKTYAKKYGGMLPDALDINRKSSDQKQSLVR